MTIICNTYLSTRNFSFHDNCFVAEASDFGPLARLYSQVYDDACDEGFVLVSHVTGDSVVCALDEVEMDGGGEDIAGWRYRVVAIPDPTKRRKWKELRHPESPFDFTVLIIND